MLNHNPYEKRINYNITDYQSNIQLIFFLLISKDHDFTFLTPERKCQTNTVKKKKNNLSWKVSAQP